MEFEGRSVYAHSVSKTRTRSQDQERQEGREKSREKAVTFPSRAPLVSSLRSCPGEAGQK